MLRVNIVKYDEENYAIFGDTWSVRNLLMTHQCDFEKALKHPKSKKVMAGWKMKDELLQRVKKMLERTGVKVYLEGK